MRRIVIGIAAILTALLILLYFIQSRNHSQEQEETRNSYVKTTLEAFQSANRRIRQVEKTYLLQNLYPNRRNDSTYRVSIAELIQDQDNFSKLGDSATKAAEELKSLSLLLARIRKSPDSILFDYFTPSPAAFDLNKNPFYQYSQQINYLEKTSLQELDLPYLSSMDRANTRNPFIWPVFGLLILLLSLLTYQQFRIQTLTKNSTTPLIHSKPSPISGTFDGSSNQHQYKTKLHESPQSKLQAIVDNTNNIYFLLDKEFKLQSYNKPAIEFCKNELEADITELEQDFMERFSPERRPFLHEWLSQSKEGNFVSFENHYVKPDQSVNWYLVKFFPVLDQAFQPVGLVVAITENTNEKMIEQEMLDKEVQDQKTIIREVLNAQENERNKIGQELHDNVNQILVSTKLYLNLAYTDHPNNVDFIKTSIDYLDEAISEIRKLSSREVTPLKQFELEDLIRSSVESIQQHSGIKTDFTYNITSQITIDEDLKLNVYRIIQEQLNNILKHAKASHIKVCIENKNGCLILSITDNGQGFDPAQDRKGIGISNIINRVISYNGEIDIQTKPFEGCSINIKIPILVTPAS